MSAMVSKIRGLTALTVNRARIEQERSFAHAVKSIRNFNWLCFFAAGLEGRL